MKKIGVYTSGGDAPGMNACVRAVVRNGLYNGCEVVGIQHGYEGMIEGNFVDLGARSVSNIIQRGGTILRTARSEQFRTPEGRARAAAQLEKAGIEGLVAIGGDGTFQGVVHLIDEHGVAAIGVPGTIDNDIFGTDYTIGFDTAVNTALEAIDRIRDTAASHERLFLVEVMGRTSGEIALGVGVAGGAEEVLIPEAPADLERVGADLRRSWERGKRSSIIVVAERIRELTGLEPRVCVLGHIQRGGTPSARDRILASRLGSAAVASLLDGGGVMAGERCGEVVHVPLRDAWEKRRPVDTTLMALVRDLV